MSAREVRVVLKVDVEPFIRAMAWAGEAAQRWRSMIRKAGREGRPVSLAVFGVDGREYHRRRKARARRR